MKGVCGDIGVRVWNQACKSRDAQHTSKKRYESGSWMFESKEKSNYRILIWD